MKLRFCLHLLLAGVCWAGTFGKVVEIGGQASDLALDEARGVIYVANFGANRIEVISTADLSLRSSLNVAAQPSSLALSQDNRYLLVAHFGNFEKPDTPVHLLTLITLDSGAQRVFALGATPLGVAFGYDNRALVVTEKAFLIFDPVSGVFQQLATVEEVTANTLSAPPADFPAEIVAASVAASGDRRFIYGLTDTIRFKYDVLQKRVTSLGYTASPPLGPRVVSVNHDGTYYAAGWALFDRDGVLTAQFPNALGLLHVGSHAIDSARGLIYAQIPNAGSREPVPPTLMVADADNLTVRERLKLPENLTGKSVLSSDGSTMYSVSDSGLMALPVGSLAQARRIVVSREDVTFHARFCNPGTASQSIEVTDPSGAATDFTLTASIPGITLSPAAGTTPALVQISVDPAVFQNRKGTVVAQITVSSSAAVNLPPPVRVLINNRGPDQRGTVVNVPGVLVDILADPIRDRFYILRQDKNQVLVFDANTFAQVATLRTGNTPTQMAFSFNRRLLLVGNDNSQIANVYDLETLTPTPPVRFPPGHYPRSLAASGRAVLAAVRSAVGPEHKIDFVDLPMRRAVELPSLGPWENNVDVDTILVAADNGASIMAAQANGHVLLYDSDAGAFTTWREDFSALSGAYAASSNGRFFVDNYLLNSSVVPIHSFDTAAGASSGFAFVDGLGLRATAPDTAGPGVIGRVDLEHYELMRPALMAEAPAPAAPGGVFTRTLAPLANRRAIVALTISGFTVLEWNYEAETAPPHIDRVVNAADYTGALAPGSLISVLGSDLSPVNMATNEMPLPSVIGESCLTVNGAPAPMLFISPTQVNAQLPFFQGGQATVRLHTPAGSSNNLTINVAPAAPAVFRTVLEEGVEAPTVIRAANNLPATLANPVHPGDVLVIYAAGLGRTSPAVEAGMPAPFEPLALAEIQPEVELGGVPLPVFFAGLTPGFAGVYQINARVPDWVPTGRTVPLTIRQGGASTTLNLRVVE
ncbi:MAG: hypothetical protein ACM3S5_02390 [Rhodospirillales bacterium]